MSFCTTRLPREDVLACLDRYEWDTFSVTSRGCHYAVHRQLSSTVFSQYRRIRHVDYAQGGGKLVLQGSDNCKPMKVDSTDNGVLQLALVDEFHITCAPPLTPIGTKRTFDRVQQSEEAATKATLQFCRTLPHIVRTTRVRTLYLSKLDFVVYEEPTIFHDLAFSFERVQGLKIESCNLRSSHVDDYFLHACNARGVTEIDAVDAAQADSLISPNGIVEFLESAKSARANSIRDKRRIEACEQGRLAERFFVYLGHSSGKNILHEMLEWYGDLHTMYVVMNDTTVACFIVPALSIEILLSKNGVTLARPNVTAFEPTV